MYIHAGLARRSQAIALPSSTPSSPTLNASSPTSKAPATSIEILRRNGIINITIASVYIVTLAVFPALTVRVLAKGVEGWWKSPAVWVPFGLFMFNGESSRHPFLRRILTRVSFCCCSRRLPWTGAALTCAAHHVASGPVWFRPSAGALRPLLHHHLGLNLHCRRRGVPSLSWAARPHQRICRVSSDTSFRLGTRPLG